MQYVQWYPALCWDVSMCAMLRAINVLILWRTRLTCCLILSKKASVGMADSTLLINKIYFNEIKHLNRSCYFRAGCRFHFTADLLWIRAVKAYTGNYIYLFIPPIPTQQRTGAAGRGSGSPRLPWRCRSSRGCRPITYVPVQSPHTARSRDESAHAHPTFPPRG